MTKQLRRYLNRLSKKNATATSVKLMLKHWNTSVQEIDEMNRGYFKEAKRLEYLVKSKSQDFKEMCSLCNSLDGAMFFHTLDHRAYITKIFHKGTDSLGSRGIYFLYYRKDLKYHPVIHSLKSIKP